MSLHPQINKFLDNLDRSPKTIRAYRYGLKRFTDIMGEDADLTSDTYESFLKSIRDYSPPTKQIWRSAVLGLYKFCKAGNWLELKEITMRSTRRPGKRIINIDRDAIEKMIRYCDVLALIQGDPLTQLRALRDRAFILTIADTGLRISEACSLKRGDINWQEYRAVIIGKGDKQAVVHFSDRSIKALKEYLSVRSRVDPDSRIPLSSQPLFASHDTRASKKIKPISASGMWMSIKGDPNRGVLGRMTEAGVDRKSIRIHDFRHYFVTTILLTTGNLKLAQVLARHERVETTGRYAHLNGEIGKAYDEIFNKHSRPP
jgi:integrase/recombinase XerC